MSFVTLLLSAAALQAQVPRLPDLNFPALSSNVDQGASAPVVRPNPDKRADRPLTPQEERERSIRLYDPLNRTDQRLDDRLGERVPDAATLPDQGTRPAEATAGSANPGNAAGPSLRNPMGSSPAVVEAQPGDGGAQDYSGPSVLSRSYTLSRPSVPRTIRWGQTLSFNSVYNTGLGPNTGPAATGSQNTNSAVGSQMSWGLSGSRAWKRDQLNVGYFGSASYFYGANRYSGSNHSLSIGYNRVLTRRISVTLSEALTSTTQSFALENQVSASDPTGTENLNLALTPAVGIYDPGTRQSNTSAQLSWQKSARTTVSLGGGAFVVERGGTGFSGATGYQSQANLQHRYTARLSVGTYYSYSNYVFTKHSSVSASNTAGGQVSYTFSRRMQANLKLGITQVETQSLTVVTLDPFIAAILGQQTGVISAYRKSRLQDISAGFTRDLGHRRSLTLGYAKGVAPGNGLIQASARENLSASLAMTLFRHYSLSLGVNGDRLSSVEATAGRYSSRGVSLSLSRPLAMGMSSMFSVDYRTVSGIGTFGTTNQLRISSGVTWGRNSGKLW